MSGKAKKSENISKLGRLTPIQLVGITILCIIAAFYLYPLFWMFDSSFRPATDIFQFPPVLFQHFFKAIQDYSLQSFKTAIVDWNVLLSFLMSVIVTVGGILGTLLVCSLCAYAFAYLEFPGRSGLFILILGTMMLPATTMVVPFYKVISTLGLSDNLLALILPAAMSAFGVFLLRQFYIKIPRALMESARIDGASHIRIWWNVIIPLSRPALAALSIVQFRTLWNDFLNPMIILKSDTLFTLPVKIQVMDSQHFNKPYDAIIATGFLTALVPMIFFMIFQRQFIEGLTGGMKE
ncbi:MAG: carbohydrate ABC transporter permease [Deltaproteobacteria bacterium]|nr:carbohydrate ABC transporter permease [Deltaproteobacteria bacterium]